MEILNWIITFALKSNEIITITAQCKHESYRAKNIKICECA